MSWDCRLSRLASKQFRRLPRDRQAQLGDAFGEMSANPMTGDVQPIKSGKFKGAFRRRIGHYRLFFSVDMENCLVKVAAILYRGENTYN